MIVMKNRIVLLVIVALFAVTLATSASPVELADLTGAWTFPEMNSLVETSV